MADDRKEYVVHIGGVPHTLLLTEATAKSYGDAAVEAKQKKEPEAKEAPAPKNKARSADSK